MAVKEHLKDKMHAYFSSLWLFGLEELVRVCVEMDMYARNKCQHHV